MIAVNGIANSGIANANFSTFEEGLFGNTIIVRPILRYIHDGIMQTYYENSTVAFFFQPMTEINGFREVVSFGGYEVGDLINGSEDGIICNLTVFDSDGNIAVDIAGNVLENVYMFGYNTTIATTDECNAAILTIASGFAVGNYSYQLWYSGDSLVTQKGSFTISAGQTPSENPPE